MSLRGGWGSRPPEESRLGLRVIRSATHRRTKKIARLRRSSEVGCIKREKEVKDFFVEGRTCTITHRDHISVGETLDYLRYPTEGSFLLAQVSCYVVGCVWKSTGVRDFRGPSPEDPYTSGS